MKQIPFHMLNSDRTLNSRGWADFYKCDGGFGDFGCGCVLFKPAWTLIEQDDLSCGVNEVRVQRNSTRV